MIKSYSIPRFKVLIGDTTDTPDRQQEVIAKALQKAFKWKKGYTVVFDEMIPDTQRAKPGRPRKS